MTDNTDLPTKDEAVAAFWAVIAPALLDLHRRGELPPPDPPQEGPRDDAPADD